MPQAVTDNQRMRGLSTITALGAAALAACGGAPKQEPSPAALAPDITDQQAWAASQNLVIKPFDLNRDGTPDLVKFYRFVTDPKNPQNRLESISRRDTDLNHDGKFDIMRLYDESGRVTEERTDLDFDGRYDQTSIFRSGQVEQKTLDLNYDDRVDVTKYYTDGKLGRIEADRDNDGKVDTWEYYEGGTLDRIGTDTTGDGVVDVWEKQREATAQEQSEATEPAPAAPGGAS